MARSRPDEGPIVTERGLVDRDAARTSAAPGDDGPEGTGRLAAGADTALRRFVRAVAIALWIPFGFVFWLPFLLRRTVTYVFSVLYAGLTGGDTRRAERRWERAVGFYQFGFSRIVHAFRSDEADPEAQQARNRRDDRDSEEGSRRLVLELAWAGVTWTAILWLTGIWPDAPEVVWSTAVGAWTTIVEAGRELVGRIGELPRL